MKTINKLRKRRAVSPVIATVILVAITITVAVAVAYWMSSIAGQYTQFEKVEIQSGYASIVFDAPEVVEVSHMEDPTPLLPLSGDEYLVIDTPYSPETFDGWRITIKLKNTGSAPSTIISCFINEKPREEYGGLILFDYFDDETQTILEMLPEGVTLESGTSVTLYVTIIKGTEITFTSGTTINVKLHSAGGMDYIRLIQLS